MKITNPPEGYHSVTAGLTVRDSNAALEFYEKAFGAKELYRLKMPDGKIAHAEFKIGDSVFMIQDEQPEWGTPSPATVGGSPLRLRLYVSDADAGFAAALAAGAKEIMPVELQFWGDRMGSVVDPFGYQWLIATRVEDVPVEEYQSRMEAFLANKVSREAL
jgi:PhnB protein